MLYVLFSNMNESFFLCTFHCFQLLSAVFTLAAVLSCQDHLVRLCPVLSAPVISLTCLTCGSLSPGVFKPARPARLCWAVVSESVQLSLPVLSGWIVTVVFAASVKDPSLSAVLDLSACL